MRQVRVDEQLQGYADDAEDGEGEADARGREGKAAGEVDEAVGREAGRVRVRGVVARRGQVDEPQGVEAADVHGQEAVCAEGGDQVAGEDAAEGEDLARGAFGLV